MERLIGLDRRWGWDKLCGGSFQLLVQIGDGNMAKEILIDAVTGKVTERTYDVPVVDASV